MARISPDRFEPIVKGRNNIHGYVDSTYCSFILNNTKIIQIDTYGSEDREIKNKISQSIQIDREMAVELLKILKDEFNI
jgi:hypothetical protein